MWYGLPSSAWAASTCMDSPYPYIEAWWPDEAPAFALSSDARFIERYETVDSLLGSNRPLPEGMQREEVRKVDVQQLIAEAESVERSDWDGIEDAFAPIRRLVSGEASLVDKKTYATYRDVGARVVSRVSLVRAEEPWTFFCLSGGSIGAPRWVAASKHSGRANDGSWGGECRVIGTTAAHP